MTIVPITDDVVRSAAKPAIVMSWHDLLFMHWPVPAAALGPFIPPGLELDTFEGQAWIAVVPFRMSGIRHRLLPAIPGLSAFAELNVRTYVTCQGKRPGVWFFSLDAANRVAVRGARWSFHLPYYDAKMSCLEGGNEIHYRSSRTHRGAPPAHFAATYRPIGEPYTSRPSTLDHWLTERYCLYSADRAGNVYRGDIYHAPWPLQAASAAVKTNSMTEPIGLKLPDVEPILHFARRLDVVGWRLTPALT